MSRRRSRLRSGLLDVAGLDEVGYTQPMQRPTHESMVPAPNCAPRPRPTQRLRGLGCAFFGSLLVALQSFGCTEIGDPALVIDTPFEVPAGPLSFALHVEPILRRGGCQGCHGSGGGISGLDTTSAMGLRAGGATGPAVIPCDAEASYLWQRVRDCEMPATGPCLGALDVAIIARWIDQGAQDVFDEGICDDPPLD